MLLLIAACEVGSGSSGIGQSTPTADHIAGAPTCPQNEAQDLTFSGMLSGHVTCSTTTATCTKAAANSQGAAGLALPIGARVGSTPVQFLIAFLNDKPGTYTAGPLGDEPSSSQQGATLDGIGHWMTRENGGPMTISVNDGTTASGVLNVRLSSGAKVIAVAGTWRCVKPPGF